MKNFFIFLNASHNYREFEKNVPNIFDYFCLLKILYLYLIVYKPNRKDLF